MKKLSCEKQLRLKLLFWSVLLFMYGAILWNYFFTQTSLVIRADLWRYIPIVANYYQSGFSLPILLLKHGEHLQLAYNLWFLINCLIFDLNTRLELFVGLVFLVGIMFVLFRAFNTSIHMDVPMLQRRLAFLPMAAIVLSFHQMNSFTYSLLAFGAFGEMLLMLIFLLVFDGILINDQKNTGTSWVVLAGIFYLLGAGFAGGGWVCYIAAAIPVVLAWQVTRHIEMKKAVWACIGLLAISIPVFLTSSLVQSQSVSGSALKAFLYLLEHAGDALHYLLMLLANSVVDVNTLENIGFTKLVVPIGVLVLAAHGAAIYLFFWLGLWKKTYIPLYLLILFWTVAFALLCFRFPVFGIANAAAPRYATSLQIGTIGVVWVFIVVLLTVENKFKWIGLSALTMCVASLYLFHLSIAVHAAPYYRQTEKNMIEIIQNEQFEKRSVACPNENLCKEGVKVLREHKLNVFK
ncbi:MAG: hypothetical protein A2464_03995 [Deltaproteobacteria bacterium RIFOXYC2_FULL_48_10]|nr:MAG: hypothetical protein A2464_03995 [Deltaproteobacteria bacterium RIFOXYC2_FULL_48_10]